MTDKDVQDLHTRLNGEIEKFNFFVQVTQKTLVMMQQTDTLVSDNIKRLASAVDDFTEQLGLQQKQIARLVEIIQLVCPDKLPEPPGQSKLGPLPGQSDTTEYQPSNDASDLSDSELDDHHSDEVDGSGK